jgi:transcriptional regulator with XRE-family HTH domain
MARKSSSRSTKTVDDFVGARVRERRVMLGLPRQQLAERMGVTHHQVQKYERGMNRISAGRLYEIASVLGAPLSYFYDEVGEETPQRAPRKLLEILRNFADIKNEKFQEAVIQLARALAS